MINAAALASAFFLATCSLPSGDLRDPHTWGNYFLDKYASERAEAMNLEPGPTPLAEPRTVLLITGVTIPAAWFDPIKARLTRDGFRPVVYEPPDLLSGDLFENSQRLADVIDNIRAETGEDKIDILAECTGGLIARYYIQSLGGDAHVSRLVTFISPQHGLPKAPLAAAYAGWPALYDLSPGSDFLDAVNNAPLPANVPVTSIYTCTDEYIQPYRTSIIPGATNIGVCDRVIGHFAFFYDRAVYMIMHDALVAALPDAGKADGTGATAPPSSVGCAAGGTSSAGVLLALALLVTRRAARSRTLARRRSNR